jgi:hypothetical protein
LTRAIAEYGGGLQLFGQGGKLSLEGRVGRDKDLAYAQSSKLLLGCGRADDGKGRDALTSRHFHKHAPGG